ncbi:hypothetical protein [Clostridium hydrogeniformans]|uniref:hypothetical protein n=1 Tax=Clostridium hydrogeniformans TaxID=349933 RepID=UPI00048A2936|nr:hypothetical protein [Clostridium hydrogeniformans]
MILKKKGIIAAALVSTLLITGTVPASASTVNKIKEDVVKQLSVTNPDAANTFRDLSNEGIEILFNAIEKMPMELLEKGDPKEISDFLILHGVDIKFADAENADENSGVILYGWWDVTKCVAAITWLVGSTILGVGLLMKLKNFIAAAGGVSAAATALVALAREGFTQANINRFGTALLETASTILGIQAIQDNCS